MQIIAASNRNLKEAIKAGEFREDLYYRLKVVDLDIPPYATSGGYPELVGLLMRQTNMSMGTNVQEVTPRAMDAIKAYQWPGNIRELRHLLERAIVFCDEPAIDLKHLLLRSQEKYLRKQPGTVLATTPPETTFQEVF